MKIIQICAAYKPAYIYGGPTMSVSKLSEELTRSKQDVTVLATTANGKTELDVAVGTETLVDDVRVYYFKRWTKDHTHFSPSLLGYLHKILKQAKKDNTKIIVHIHAWWNLVSILSCWLAKMHKVPVILSPRGMLNHYTTSNKNSLPKKLIHSGIGKKLLNYTYIHATSFKEQTDIKETCTTKSINVIPNFVKLSHLALKEAPPYSHSFRLLFLSRIEQKKGLEILFESLSKLDFNWELSIAGSGEEQYLEMLKKYAQDLNIAHHIKWIGYVNGDKKFEIMANHDLLVLTSFNENFANVIIEALSVGTPVLVSKEVGLADYILQNNMGWVCKHHPNEIAQGLEEAFQSKDKRNHIRQNAPETIKKDFDTDLLVNQYISLYHDLTTY
ncbi:XrtY-associated glycosyltransferase XYAG1 [Pedobacter montanisoli]|uniref:Glycosyltransferase n=1 Tax=Pedobacter montanisoli TaxID=2923277 RepID=A0ABS9ZVU7_9SPHI|nr:glycosyltransferase [Pedobacter montanisoli]MCJ0742429.1 glycosyltransferase [Pedobacter montanisoli]